MSEQHNSVTELLKDITTPTQDQQPQQPEIKTEIHAETVTPPTPPETEIKPTVEPDKPLDMEVLANGADIAIGLFDFSQTGIFAAFARKKKKRLLIDEFGDNAVNTSKKLINEIEAQRDNKLSQTNIREFSPDEFGMLRIEKNAAEYIDDLPLTEDEKKVIKVPLIEIMKKRGGSIPPEYLLMLGILQISGARAAELHMM